jgi:hypothetical protein
MTVVPVFANAAFGTETTSVLGAAFEAAWQAVEGSDCPPVDESEAVAIRDILAKRIIEMGRRGERDHGRLVEDALDHLAKLRSAGEGAIAAQSEAAMPQAQVRGLGQNLRS